MRRKIRFGWAMAFAGFMLFLPSGVFAQAEAAAPAEVSQVAPQDAPQGVPQDAAQDVPREVPPGGFVHTVVEGDTLWDLSAKYLGSPWRWNEIWELNRFVTNPHYIYPGIKIVIVPSGPIDVALVVDSTAAAGSPAESVEPVSSPAPAAAPAATVPAVVAAPSKDKYLDIIPDQIIRAGQFSRNKPSGIGKIYGGKEPKEGFSTGDMVFLSLDQQVSKGQLLALYRVRGPLKTPGNKVSSGYVTYMVGVLQVASTEDGRLTAKVRESFEDITRDDIIIAFEIPSFSRIKIDPGPEGNNATVIASRSINMELAAGDFIFIDSGSDSGVQVGNVFRIYKALEFETGAGAAVSKTMVEVARSVVVRADKEFSTLIVVSSENSFYVGSQARSGLPAK